MGKKISIFALAMLPSNNDFSRLELNLPNCLNNFRYFRSLLEPETKMLILVKANAYGHGSVELASMMQKAGADYLAVAMPVEGVELRKAGISLPIIILTAGTDFFNEITQYRLEPGIPNIETLKDFILFLEQKDIRDYPIHIKLDTGMHRLGFMETELEDLIHILSTSDRVRVKSIYSHLAASEDPMDDEYTLGQLNMFEKFSSLLIQRIGYKPLRHILNSAGIERFPKWQYDMVRLGIGLYGISAIGAKGLAPVASLKVKILQIKHLMPSDGTIGYGRFGHVSANGTTIATIPVGYADGINRHFGRGKASFFLNGHLVPTIGNICMDMCMLDISGVEAKVGDTVTIFGDTPSVSDLAEKLGTIPYEILTSVPKRIERVVIRKQG